VSTATGNQDTVSVAVVSGSRSAIVSWSDSRSGGLDLYAQRLNSSGAVGTDFTLTSSAGPGGKIVPPGATPVNQGTSKSFGVAPTGSRRVKDVLAEGGPAGAPRSYAFANIAASHSIGTVFDTTLAGGSAGWIADGVGIAQGPGAQTQPAMVSDGTG